MADKIVKIPGPDHPITIERTGAHVVVTLGGEVLADTRRALSLAEAAYPAVQYIPRSDVAMDRLVRTDHMTYCPVQGGVLVFQPARRGRGERRVDLRGPVRRGSGNQGPPGVLPEPGGHRGLVTETPKGGPRAWRGPRYLLPATCSPLLGGRHPPDHVADVVRHQQRAVGAERHADRPAVGDLLVRRQEARSGCRAAARSGARSRRA